MARVRIIYFMRRLRDILNAVINWSWCHGASFHGHTDAVAL